VSNGQTVARTIALFADRTLSPEALSRHLAQAARRLRDEAIRSGEAPDSYDTFVDGRAEAAEDSVRPNGVIVYRFNLLAMAVQYAWEEWHRLAPVDTGDYRRSVLVSVNGMRWPRAFKAIPRSADVMLVDPVPYGNRVDIRTNIIMQVRQRVRRSFPTVDAQKTYVHLPPSFSVSGYDVPYRRDSKGAFPGQEMLYRALALSSGY